MQTAPFLETIGIAPNWVMPAMSVGQIVEVGTMAVLGYCLKRLGWRNTMVVGILGHALRFAVYAFAPFPFPAVAINVVHGICYAFFFATVYIFVDEFFPKDARTSAQGLFNLQILGLGPCIGYFLWAWLGDDVFKTGSVVDYKALFLVPTILALAAAGFLFLFFRPPRQIEPVPEQVPVAVEGVEQFQAKP